MNLEPGGIIAWLIVGAIAGWLAGQVMTGAGFGLLADVVVGIAGALIGGWVLSLFGIAGTAGFVGSIIVAFLGAVILVAILRALAPRRTTY
jgi:uncharacterized membrane protein YeaQ/YmgE (transglycosylase-associated protein family)